VARLGYVPALDGLRGIAIALVVTLHYTDWPYGGAYGVDLFFVLSGFLITTLLLEEREKTGRIRLGRFYVRRARRLFPALALMLAAYLVFAAVVRGQNALLRVAEYGLYGGNIYSAFVRPAGPSGLGHLWSLAVEEQFYLVWPVCLLVLLRTRRPGRWLALLLAALVCYRFALIAGHASSDRLYFPPDTRSEGLLLGCLLAFARRNGFVAREWVAKAGLMLAVPAVLVGQFRFGLPVFELGAVALVAAGVAKTELAGLLSWRPLVGLGKISYSLYLWQSPVGWAFVPVPLASAWHLRPPALAVSLALAYASYRLVELPFRARAGRTAAVATRPARPDAAALAVES
jgi:peptidoglycan/LPS O-acetylase OafA/YrhL